MKDRKQNPGVRIQESEEEKNRRKARRAFHSGFWLLTPEFFILASVFLLIAGCCHLFSGAIVEALCQTGIPGG
jgi:hypothetical protein